MFVTSCYATFSRAFDAIYGRVGQVDHLPKRLFRVLSSLNSYLVCCMILILVPKLREIRLILLYKELYSKYFILRLHQLNLNVSFNLALFVCSKLKKCKFMVKFEASENTL